MPSFLTWIQSKYNDFMSRKSPKKYKIYKYNYTCNRLPKKNLLKKYITPFITPCYDVPKCTKFLIFEILSLIATDRNILLT